MSTVRPPRRERGGSDAEEEAVTDYQDLITNAGAGKPGDPGFPSDGDATDDLSDGFGRHFELQQDQDDTE